MADDGIRLLTRVTYLRTTDLHRLSGAPWSRGSGRLGGGVADDQRGAQRLVRVLVLAADGRDEEVRRGAALRHDRLPHRGQPGTEPRGFRKIVETGHRHAGRHVEA